MTTDPASSRAAPQRQLNLFDSTCIIVGIIVGVAIFRMSPLIASKVAGPWVFLGVWLLGGLISLIGALCYAELASAYPEEGGDYAYLTRAFGPWCGFVFAWAQLWVVRPGSIGAMAYVFAEYASQIYPLAADPRLGLLLYASAAIAVLSLINMLGVAPGKWTQNLLTSAKVVGLLAVVVAGLLAPLPAAAAPVAAGGSTDFWLAMIFILWAYGGWNEMAYVAAEVRHPERNILRALALGTLAVAAIYLLVNLAYLHALGFEGVRGSTTIAADVLGLTSTWGARVVSVLICISALGAINGMVFTGSRIYYAMGQDHRLFAPLGRWHARLGTPVWSLAIQAVITLLVVAGFGTLAVLAGFSSGFESMVIFTSPAFWFFLLLAGVSLFVLRWREPHVRRPFRVPAYPILPLLFCLSSAFMVYSSVDYAVHNKSWEAWWSIGLLAVGVVLAFVVPRPTRRETTP